MPLKLGEYVDISAVDGVWSASEALPALKSLVAINRGTFPVELRTTADGAAESKLSANGASGSLIIWNFDAATTAPTVISARGVGGASTVRILALPVPATVGVVGPAGGGDISLSNAAPAGLAGAAAAGTAETASRADHVHPLPAVANVDLARAFDLGSPTLADTLGVHNDYADNVAVDWPGPFSNPDVPRNLTVTFNGAWDGGDVTVSGTDQYDQPVSEVFVFAAPGTVTGSKIFKTATSAQNGQLGASGTTASIGTGDRLGVVITGDVVALVDSGGLIAINGSAAVVTVDEINDAVYDPGGLVVPDGVNSMTAIANVTHRHTLS